MGGSVALSLTTAPLFRSRTVGALLAGTVAIAFNIAALAAANLVRSNPGGHRANEEVEDPEDKRM